MNRPKDCYHCGDTLPGGPEILARLGGKNRSMCCVGCKAVAEFIDSSGLSAFYDFRSRPDSSFDLTPEATEWQLYDADDLMHRYVHLSHDNAETTIDIGGMYCSACVWLLNNALQQVDGVDAIDVNPATRRAVISWDLNTLKFSELLEAISNIGFKPAPVGVGYLSNTKDGEYRQALKRLIVAAAAGMQVMMFAVALYAGDFFGIEAGMEKFFRTISLLVILPVVFYSARPFFRGAWRGIRARTPGMDLPVSIAIAAAFLASVRAVWLDQGDIYFDSVAMFVFFLSATRFLEMRARHRSDDHSLALAQLLPDTANRVVSGAVEKVALDRIRVHDTISIRPGDVVPTDGIIESGSLAIDEAMLTGESLPANRDVGSMVYAGSVVRSGNATIRVTRTGASTSLAEIGRLLERAKADRPPIALLADRIASRFVIAVLGIAASAAVAWQYLDPTRSFEVALATLVVTCPCALALATPAALAAATARLAQNGFLLVRSRVLEVLGNRAIVVFDKTGTLTEGRPVVLNTEMLADLGEQPGEQRKDDILALAAAIETASEHVLARAFSEYYRPGSFYAQQLNVVSGSGVEATVDDRRYRIGSARYVADLSGTSSVKRADHDGRTQVYLGDQDRLLACFTVGDKLRADAVTAIAKLRASGFTPVIASGDNEGAVSNAAKRLGIDEWHAQLSPQGKLDYIASLQATGQKVVMVGDGINDAPVLAAADASIALDAGTALARASADAISLGKKLGTLVTAIEVSRKTRRIIRQNIVWAIVYNVTAVPLAVTGTLAPWMAAIGMSTSSLLVLLNALRLHKTKVSGEFENGIAITQPIQSEAAT